MAGQGIDLSTCPQARIVPAVCSPAEFAFAATLKQALKSKVLILLKVRVLDVLELVEEPDKRRMFFWRDLLGDTHFDYVIYSRQTLAPLLAVELDDDVPLRPGQATRDVAKNTVANRAMFPLVCISATEKLTPLQLRQELIDDYERAKAGTLPVEMV